MNPPKCTPTSGPLHLLFPLPGMLFAPDTYAVQFPPSFRSQLWYHLIRQAFFYFSLSKRSLPLTPLYFLTLGTSPRFILYISWFFGLAPALKCKVGKKTTDYFATVLSAFRPLKTFSRCSINGFSMLKKPLPKGFSSNLSLLLFFLFMHQMGTLLISFLVWLWFLTFL